MTLEQVNGRQVPVVRYLEWGQEVRIGHQPLMQTMRITRGL